MILGTGIDLISVARIEALMKKFPDKFLEKVFTKNEILAAQKIKISDQNLSSSAIFFAKRFAAKEAFSKALGLGIGRGINFNDIEVQNDEFGRPKIQILNGKENFLRQHFSCENFSIHLSLSDESSLANAIVIIEKIS